MRRYLNWFLNGFAITFAIPSFLIIISWNALPGDRLYGVKTGLENVALGITIKTPLASVLSVKYTQRRFDEAGTLLASKGSTLGYSLLVQEARKSQGIIADKNDKAQAQELIKKIQDYKKKIEEKKIAIEEGYADIPVSSLPPSAQPTEPAQPTISPNYPYKTPAPAPTPIVIPNVVTPENNTQEVVDDLEKTKEDLDEIEQEVSQHAASTQSTSGKNLQQVKQPDKNENRGNRQERKEEATSAPQSTPTTTTTPSTPSPTP